MFDCDLYLSRAVSSCFDNDGDGSGEGAGEGSGGAGGVGGAGEGSGGGEKVFKLTQTELNAMMAENKKTLRANLEKAQSELQAISQKYSMTAEEKAQMEENLENMRKDLLTKEERSKEEQRKLKSTLETQIKDLETRATQAEKRYTEAIITRAIKDAANMEDGHDSDQFVAILYNRTKLVDEKPMIDFPFVDDSGEEKVLFLSPLEAVKKMKEMPKYINLFKSNVVGGLGGNSNTGIFGPGNDGRVDPSKIKTMDEYRKHRAKILESQA